MPSLVYELRSNQEPSKICATWWFDLARSVGNESPLAAPSSSSRAPRQCTKKHRTAVVTKRFAHPAAGVVAVEAAGLVGMEVVAFLPKPVSHRITCLLPAARLLVVPPVAPSPAYSTHPQCHCAS